MAPIVYLISGANRGIGLGFVTALARRDNVIVFASASNPTAAEDLHSLVQHFPGKVHIVKLTSCEKTDNSDAAVATIKAITAFDQINAVGTLVLFQATYPLLTASTPSPKFIPISSSAGSIANFTPLPVMALACGSSKAALNYLARKLHFEYENLICFPINPGRVATDIVTFANNSDELMKSRPVITVEESVKSLLNVIDNSTREKTGGLFRGIDSGDPQLLNIMLVCMIEEISRVLHDLGSDTSKSAI
ncbi:hypothetical protein PILCRDRAFT_88746 [Piloderma croceum F 1598]|uniref:Ketoreductase (KR) domain-containing protein n=1 Tax=Piloderma croceum (strain F 1598) TaxID=765440 RepID=A0A0C3B7R9_PILCF|nr:hypothetical protein PILCRDRAFT_88746 [Piloderma croceum F 1598]